MDTSTIKIAVVGNNYDDFIQYITRVLYHLNLRTCVIDCSHDKAWNYPIRDDQSIFNYRGIDFIFLENNYDQINELDLLPYECCIYSIGINEELLSFVNQFDTILIITSILKKDINQLTSFIKKIESHHPLMAIRVLRDYVNTKMNKMYFDRELDREEIRLMQEYILYLSEDTYQYRLQSQYNDHFKFNYIDKDMKRALMEILNYYIPASEKRIKKAYRLAERGK